MPSKRATTSDRSYTHTRHLSLRMNERWVSLPNNFFMVLYDHVQHLAFIASPAPLPPTSNTTTFDSEKTPEKGFSLLVFPSSHNYRVHLEMRNMVVFGSHFINSNCGLVVDIIIVTLWCLCRPSRSSLIIRNWRDFFRLAWRFWVSTWRTIKFNEARVSCGASGCLIIARLAAKYPGRSPGGSINIEAPAKAWSRKAKTFPSLLAIFPPVGVPVGPPRKTRTAEKMWNR